MYTSLIEMETDQNVNLILGLIYGKYKDGWKLNICQIDNYRFNKMTAIDFYKKSKAQYEKGYIIDAANNIYLANELLNPNEKIWLYKDKATIEAFFTKIKTEIEEGYEFPMEVHSSKYKPQILGIVPAVRKEGVVPYVNYKTEIDINDTIALKKEYLEVAAYLKQKFKGFDSENDIAGYRAFVQFLTEKQ